MIGNFKQFATKHANIALVMAIAIYFRLVMLFSPKDFWHDEAFQYLFSLKPVSFIMAANDVHPPLFNLYTHYLVGIFSNHIILLRFFGATIFSIMLVFVLYYALKNIFDEQTGFFASLLVAVSPTFVYYAVEFRNYSFTLFIVIFQIWAFNRLIRALKSGRYKYPRVLSKLFIIMNKITTNNVTPPKRPILPVSEVTFYVVLTTLALYSHFLVFMVVLAQAAYIAYLRWRKEFTNHELIIIVFLYNITFVLCIPLLTYFLEMVSKVESFWFGHIGLISLLSTFSYLVTPPTAVPCGIATLLYGVVLFSVWRFRKEWSNNHTQFAMLVILPILTMWLVSVFLIPFYHHRYFLFGGLGLYAIAGWAFARLDRHTIDWGKILFMVLVMLIIMCYNREPPFTHELYDTAKVIHDQYPNYYATVTDSQFAQSPLKVYLPFNSHYLVTNFTDRQRFSAGGSVISEYEVYSDITDVPRNPPLLWVSDKPIKDKPIVYEGDGIYVQQLS